MDINIDKNVTVEIIGDSILNGLVDRGLSKMEILKRENTLDAQHVILKTPRYTYNWEKTFGYYYPRRY